jgi:hypothetical protein
MFRACLIARVNRRWCVVHTPVKRRGTILPRSATNCCSSLTSRYGIASIFSVQNLHTFLRRKNLPRPPGPPGPRPPPRGPAPGPDPGPELCPELGPEPAPCDSVPPDGLPCVSSGIAFPLHVSLVQAGAQRPLAINRLRRAGNLSLRQRQSGLAMRWPATAQQLPALLLPQRAVAEARSHCSPCAACRAVPLPWPGAFLPRPCAR